MWIVLWGPSRHGEILLVRGREANAEHVQAGVNCPCVSCSARQPDSLHVPGKLPNVHCSRVER